MLSDFDRAYCHGYSREKERQDFFSVFERAFVEWEDRTLNVKILSRQTDHADLGNLWFGFSVFALKTAVFRFWCLVRFTGFLRFSLWFSVCVSYDGGFFTYFCQMYFMVFLVWPEANF